MAGVYLDALLEGKRCNLAEIDRRVTATVWIDDASEQRE